MGRDVEFDVVTNDDSDPGLASAEAKYRAAQERMREESKKTGKGAGDSLKDGIDRASPGIIGSLKSSFGAGGAAGGPAMIAGIAAAAPLIGGLISAGIIGGAGIGGVIGGVMLVAQDPRVKAAGGVLAGNLMSDLREDATPFVEPVIAAIGKIEQGYQRMRGRVQGILADAAAFVDPLVDGLLGGVDGIIRGVESLTSRGKPVIDAMGRSFTIVGDSVGDAFEIISGGSEDAATALEDTAQALGAIIVAVAGLVRALTEVYGVISFLPSKITGASEWFGRLIGITDDATESQDGLARGLQMSQQGLLSTAAASELTAQYLADSEKAAADAAQATRDLVTANQSLYDSETNLHAALDKATDARRENGRTLDVNSEKGRANRDVLLGVASAARREFDAFVKVNGEGPRSAAVGDRLRDSFVKTAQSFNLSADKANRLADEILGIPRSHNTKISADPSDAVAASRDAKRAINSVHSRTVSIDVIVNTSRIAAVERRLSRLHGGAFSTGTFATVAAGGAETVRTGGPTPVSVTAAVESNLYLDGRLVYAMTDRQIHAAAERNRWRNAVGRR